MAVGGINKWKDFASKHQIRPECEELAVWGGTGQPNPSRKTKFSGADGDRDLFIFPIQLTTSRIDNCTRLIHTLLHVMTIRTYIFHTSVFSHTHS